MIMCWLRACCSSWLFMLLFLLSPWLLLIRLLRCLELLLLLIICGTTSRLGYPRRALDRMVLRQWLLDMLLLLSLLLLYWRAQKASQLRIQLALLRRLGLIHMH